MKTKIYVYLAMFIFLNTAITFAQTNVSGGIYANTTWAKANSPYVVTGNIVLFPGKVLTIEPGVSVKFDGNYNIEIRGQLVSIGTVQDSIQFISNTSQSKGAWGSIQIMNSSQNASVFFDYCIVKHATGGVSVECCWGNSSSYVRHALFENNTYGLSGYSGWNLPVDHCIFNDNTIAISPADKLISNCIFTNNGTGIGCERFEVRKSLFQNNGSAIEYFANSYGTVDSCTIVQNVIGIHSGGPITNSTISNNDIGILTTHTSYTVNGIDYYVPIKHNRICNNTTSNIKNTNNYNKNITQNCFCTEDSTAIENKLYDGYDDITLGLFNYDIYDTTCQMVLRSVYKIGTNPSGTGDISNASDISVFPNPFNDFIIIQHAGNINTQYTLRIYNMQGQKVRELENIYGRQSTIDSRDLERGIYLLQYTGQNSVVMQRKLIKE